jgi:phosphate transport system permease protein
MTEATVAGRLARATTGISRADRAGIPRYAAFLAAGSMILIVLVMIVFISWNGVQIFVSGDAGLGDVLSTRWAPNSSQQKEYGLLPMLAGSLGTVAIGVILSAPLAVGLALFLAEVAPPMARSIVQPALEVFVGIPSVVWGFMGATALAPFLGPAGLGITPLPRSMLAGGLVLTVMILPTVTAVAYDSIRSVPEEWRQASYGLGSTRWQLMRHVVIPGSMTGILTAVVLGTARAAGEALAVQMVVGNRPKMPTSIVDPVATLTTQITMDMGNTTLGSTWNDALWTMALVLLGVSLTFVILTRRLGRSSTHR